MFLKKVPRRYSEHEFCEFYSETPPILRNYDKTVKDKKIKKMFKLIADFFEDLYSFDDIVSWNGDPSIFDKFKDRIDVYFEMYDL